MGRHVDGNSSIELGDAFDSAPQQSFIELFKASVEKAIYYRI